MKRHNSKSSRSVNQVRIKFTSKPITAWGGIGTLIAKFFEQIELREWVEKAVPIQETSPNGGGVYEKVLAQFLTILTGGYRFSHMGWWMHGVDAIKKCFGVDWLPKDSSSLTRFWGKIKHQGLANDLAIKARELTAKLINREGIKEDNLNLDSSVFTRYGEQEGVRKGYNPQKKGRPSHHPLIAFLGSGYIMNLWNRTGSTHSSHQCVEFYEQTSNSLPKDLKITMTLADSGFYQIDFIEHMETSKKKYIIVAPISRVIQRELLGIEQWTVVDKGIEVTEFRFRHEADRWFKERRYVAIRQEINQRPKAGGKTPYLFKDMEDAKDYRFQVLLTNDETTSAVEIWRSYLPRANDENVIKDMKEGYGWAAFSMKKFWSTEAVMVMNGLVLHNLIHFLNKNVLHTSGALAQLRTIRMRLFVLPAQLGRGGGELVLRLGVKDRSLRSKLHFWLSQIASLSFNLNRIANATQ